MKVEVADLDAGGRGGGARVICARRSISRIRSSSAVGRIRSFSVEEAGLHAGGRGDRGGAPQAARCGAVIEAERREAVWW